jgi:glycosyltransferase involved in cell wall biosynthesis
MIKSKYLDGVSVLLHTLNNEDEIEGALQTIIENAPEQIIVVDGGSGDATVEIARRYTNEVYITPPGFANQQKVGLKHVRYSFLLMIESDHRYPNNFIISLRKELIESQFYGIQGSLKCTQHNNFYERGISVLYEIHQLKKGSRDLIGGPSIYYSDIYIDKICLDGFNGYSIDTRKGEIEKKLGLKVGLGFTLAYQHQHLNTKTFFKKYFNYGKGDYDFFTFNKKEWSIIRRLKSIFHVFNRYILVYPFKAILIGKPIAITYFWLSAIVRYYGWGYSIFKNMLKKVYVKK